MLCIWLLLLGIEDEQLPYPINIHNNILSLLRANSLQDRRAKVRIQCSLLNEQGYSQHRQPEYFTWIVTEELPVRERSEERRVGKECTYRWAQKTCRKEGQI